MDAVVPSEEWQGLEELREVLRAVLSRRCRDESEAEDVIQETYLRAARYRSSLTEKTHLRSWIIRIALNVLADWRRRSQRYQPAVPEDSGLLAQGDQAREDELGAPYRLEHWHVEKDTALGVLAQALQDLKREDQRVLGSFYHGTQNCRETAAECDIPAHLVKVRLFRARRRLRRAVRGRLAQLGGARATWAE